MKMKQNITELKTYTGIPPTILEQLKNETHGLSVPDQYFETLNTRIVDRIRLKDEKSFFNFLLPSQLKKPVFWAPIFITSIAAIIMIGVLPIKTYQSPQLLDEWSEIGIAYDPTYAEEALLAEGSNLDVEIEKADIKKIESVSFVIQHEPTDEEITAFIKDHALDTNILNQN